MSLKYTFISEALVQRCSVKKVFLEISQNSEENTCVRVSFLIKLQPQTSGLFWITSDEIIKVVIQRCSVKKVFLEISQNSLEKHLCQIPFFNKVASLSGTGCEFREISNNTFSHRTPPVAASEITIEYSKKLQNIFLSSTSKRQRCI